MPEGTDAYTVNPRTDRGRDTVSEIKASPYISGSKTPYQGEWFIGYVEGEDYVLWSGARSTIQHSKST